MDYNKRIVKTGIIAFASLVLVVSVLIAVLFNVTSHGTNMKGFRIKTGTRIFYNLGCVKCHSIRILNIEGAHVGPDLSGAYSNVEKIYRESLYDFLKSPSGTMYFVLMFNHLTKRDRKIIVSELKIAQDMKITKRR